MKSHRIATSRGLELPIAGWPEQAVFDGAQPSVAGVVGEDWPGIKPRVVVREGEQVKVGQPLLYDKRNPDVPITSPAGGTVTTIARGDRRKLLSVSVTIDGEEQYEDFSEFHIDEGSEVSEAFLRKALVTSGLWNGFRTRPYSQVPQPDATPQVILVNACDTHPLAAEPSLVLRSRASHFSRGVAAIASAFPSIPVLVSYETDHVIPQLRTEGNVRLVEVQGPHPSGLSGTILHFVYPVSAECVGWTIGYQDVIAIGGLLATGRLDPTRHIAICGPPVQHPRIVTTRSGACVSEIMDREVTGKPRLISGSPLGGYRAEGPTDFLGRYHLQMCAFEESDARKVLNWANPGLTEYSARPVFASALMPGQEHPLTTGINGEPRAYVPLGIHEEIFPLDVDISPLLRALLVGDIVEAARLGAMELDPEDLAICTFACPSKFDYGRILQRQLERMQSEL